MPTKTALVITIGDVIESRPLRHNRLTTSSSSSSGSSDHEVRVRRVSRQFSETMKTRTLATSTTAVNGNDKYMLNGGCNGVRKGRIMSADQIYGSQGPLSPRTRSGIKQEIDDEVSFVGPILMDSVDDKNSNGDSSGVKKKRKSFNEKFLEDNSDYYGFQDSSPVEKRGRQRHKSAGLADVSDVANGSDSESIGVRRNAKLRVAVEKLHVDVQKHSHTSDDEDVFSSASGKSSRKGSAASCAMSPSSRKRRSELDKLLEAGSTSFHFETARETASRLNGSDNLGPIHVDVNDGDLDKEEPQSSEEEVEEVAESDDHEEEPKKSTGSRRGSAAKTNGRLLQQADSVKPKKRGNPWKGKSIQHTSQPFLPPPPPRKLIGRPPKGGKRRLMEQALAREREENEKRSEIEKYLPMRLFDELEASLQKVDSDEVDVDALQFSFERTPFRESWFATYSRQDQGEEILYYPEPKSFQLPYEMPISTFYPKKDGPGGKFEKRGRKRKIDTEASSSMPSLTPSGTATPVEEDTEPMDEGDPWARAPPPKPVTRGKRGGHSQAPRQNLSFEGISDLGNCNAYLNKLGSRAAAALSEYSRKSPRGHASTRSLFSTPGDSADITDSEADGLIDVESVGKLAHLIDECSNDSAASHFSRISNMADQTVQDTIDPALIDEFLRQADPDLTTGDASTCTSPAPGEESRPNSGEGQSKKKQKRRSSERRHHHKHHRRSKDPNSSSILEDPMDRFVAANVDELLLDCLEDELPIVPLDAELPGSEPLELLENYSKCDVMALCSRWKPRPRPFLRTDSTSSSSNVDTKEKEPTTSGRDSPRKFLLKKQMGSPKRNEKVSKSPKVSATEEDSSSEYTSACESLSIASSAPEVVATVRRTKKKRNISGYQKPIKKKLGNRAVVPVLPKVTLKVPPRPTGRGRGGKRLGRTVSPLKNRRLVPVRNTASRGGRGKRSGFIRRRIQQPRKSEVDDNDDVIESGNESESDSLEVFQLKSSKKLKLVVRKKNAPSRRGGASNGIKIRRPRKTSVCRKSIVDIDDDDDEDEDDEDVQEVDDNEDDDESEVESDDEDEPVRESLRLKTKTKLIVPKRRKK